MAGPVGHNVAGRAPQEEAVVVVGVVCCVCRVAIVLDKGEG